MTRALIIAAMLAFAIPTPAQAKGCMGASKVLCQFAHKHRLKVISGYRHRALIQGTRQRSLHSYRRAIDVRGCGARCKREASRRGYGLGIYCRGLRHVHISIGQPEAGRVFYKGCRVKRRRR